MLPQKKTLLRKPEAIKFDYEEPTSSLSFLATALIAWLKVFGKSSAVLQACGDPVDRATNDSKSRLH